MKKLVVKTIFITIAVILAVCFAVMSAFCVFKPRIIAKMFDGLGKYDASQYFYERQYEKTQEIDDLFALIDNAYEKQDVKGLRKYVGNLISHKDFKAYYQNKNTGLKPGDMQTEEYYASWYAELLFMAEGFASALKFSRSYVVKADGSVYMGYTKFNPMRTLATKNQELSAEQKQALIKELSALQTKLTDSTEIDYIREDLDKLN